MKPQPYLDPYFDVYIAQKRLRIALVSALLPVATPILDWLSKALGGTHGNG